MNTSAGTQDADRQIKQMVNFILQEAEEKANEIRIKTEHDFNLEKQMLVHNAKLKIQDEYTRKEKEREINLRISRSAAIGASRRKKMIAREALLQSLIEDGKEACRNVASRDPMAYQELLKNLIVQGLIKLYETKVSVRCREMDLALIQAVLTSASQEYIQLMKSEANLDVTMDLSVNSDEKALLPAHRYV